MQLDAQWGCKLFGQPERPAFCVSLRPERDMCGTDRADAMARLAWLEQATLTDNPEAL